MDRDIKIQSRNEAANQKSCKAKVVTKASGSDESIQLVTHRLSLLRIRPDIHLRGFMESARMNRCKTGKAGKPDFDYVVMHHGSSMGNEKLRCFVSDHLKVHDS